MFNVQCPITSFQHFMHTNVMRLTSALIRKVPPSDSLSSPHVVICNQPLSSCVTDTVSNIPYLFETWLMVLPHVCFLNSNTVLVLAVLHKVLEVHKVNIL